MPTVRQDGSRVNFFFFLFVSINNACFAQDDRDLDWIKRPLTHERAYTQTQKVRDNVHTRTNTTHGNKLSVCS